MKHASKLQHVIFVNLVTIETNKLYYVKKYVQLKAVNRVSNQIVMFVKMECSLILMVNVSCLFKIQQPILMLDIQLIHNSILNYRRKCLNIQTIILL